MELILRVWDLDKFKEKYPDLNPRHIGGGILIVENANFENLQKDSNVVAIEVVDPNYPCRIPPSMIENEVASKKCDENMSRLAELGIKWWIDSDIA